MGGRASKGARGATRERTATKGAGFDLEEERLLAEWIQNVTSEPRPDLSLFEWLNNGQVLCNMVNKIRPGSIVRVNKMLAPKAKIENLNNFILFCINLGIPKEQMFEPEDLIEKNNTAKVVSALYAFSAIISKIVPQYAGPTLELPETFAGYYRSHFKQAEDMKGIHDRFAAFHRPRTNAAPLSPPKDAAPLSPPKASQLLPSMGSFHGGAGSFGGVLVVNEKVEASKEFLPSMGSFHGAAGAFGGVFVFAEKPKAITVDVGDGFLPSMGSFGGAVGRFGGVLSPRR